MESTLITWRRTDTANDELLRSVVEGIRIQDDISPEVEQNLRQSAMEYGERLLNCDGPTCSMDFLAMAIANYFSGYMAALRCYGEPVTTGVTVSCPRCIKGRMFHDYGGMVCLNCGYIPVTVKPFTISGHGKGVARLKGGNR